MRIRGTHLLVLVAMCGLIASSVGLITNVAGLFFIPVSEELGIGKGDVSLTLTICNICFALGGMVAPRLMKEQLLRPLLVGATAAMVLSTAALSLCRGIVPMYLLSVIRGFSGGTIGMVFATSVVGNWFRAKLGLVTSITFGCSGIAGAVLSPVVSGFIDSFGWREGYLLVALLVALLNLPAILCVPSIEPRATGLRAFGDEGGAASAGRPQARAAAAGASAQGVSPLLFALVLGYAVICSALTALPQHFPGMAEAYGAPGIGALMISASMVANTGGKLALGALTDRFGAQLSCLIGCVVVGAGVVLLALSQAPVLMVVGAACFGLCFALGTVGISMLTRAVFGDESYQRTYPTMSLGGNISNAVFSSAVGFMYDASGGYGITMMTMAVMAVATAVLIQRAFAVQRAAQPVLR